MSWSGRFHFLPLRRLTAASTAVAVCARWQPVFTANSPQRDDDAAQMKLKYSNVDSPRLAKLTEMDISTAISKETATIYASKYSAAPLKMDSTAVDSPVLARVTENPTDISTTSKEGGAAATSKEDADGASPVKIKPTEDSDSPRLVVEMSDDISTSSKETAATAPLEIKSTENSSGSPQLVKEPTETDSSSTASETTAAASLEDIKSVGDSDSPHPAKMTETPDISTTSKETESSNVASGVSPSSTVSTTSSEMKGNGKITENTINENDKPEPLGFGDCDPYELQDYYVDPSDPDEDTEAGPCRNEFRNWQKCIEIAKDRGEDHMFACRCSEATEIMAKCITLHPEYYDSDLVQNSNGKEPKEKESDGEIRSKIDSVDAQVKKDNKNGNNPQIIIDPTATATQSE